MFIIHLFFKFSSFVWMMLYMCNDTVLLLFWMVNKPECAIFVGSFWKTNQWNNQMLVLTQICGFFKDIVQPKSLMSFQTCMTEFSLILASLLVLKMHCLMGSKMFCMKLNQNASDFSLLLNLWWKKSFFICVCNSSYLWRSLFRMASANA